MTAVIGPGHPTDRPARGWTGRRPHQMPDRKALLLLVVTFLRPAGANVRERKGSP